MIRFFDIVLSLIGLVILLPVFLVISIWIKLDSPGPIFFKQDRVGLNGIDFHLIKFRTMFLNSDRKGLLTVGNSDNRVTSSGYFLRKFKIDELPQLANVFIGKMSIVGPRPEVRKYVDLYTEDQRLVLSVPPGITDYSSIKFRNENELLAKSSMPEECYIKDILPIKLKLNMIYIRDRSIYQYFKIIILTLFPGNNFSDPLHKGR
jgi:lipopolysaccharide/colanic/teichoic acid biosynthesis glycosyltransferase